MLDIIAIVIFVLLSIFTVTSAFFKSNPGLAISRGIIAVGIGVMLALANKHGISNLGYVWTVLLISLNAGLMVGDYVVHNIKGDK